MAQTGEFRKFGFCRGTDAVRGRLRNPMVAYFVNDPANQPEAPSIMSARVGLAPGACKPLLLVSKSEKALIFVKQHN